MSGDTRTHLNRSTQRRFIRIFLVVSAIVVLVLAPLVVRGDWRLALAHRLDLVPGSGVERIAGAGAETTLIVIPIQATSATGRDEDRFHAAFLADSSAPGGVTLTSLDTDRSIELPLDTFDFFSASYDGSHVLFQDRRNPSATEGVLVTVDTLETTVMPAESPFPMSIPGDWETDSWRTSPGSCDGVSPNARYIFCFQRPALATFLAGDWQIQVLVYGDSDQVHPVYRGTGLHPWAGFSKDDSRLYFENEEGIWVALISDEMFT